MSIKYNIEHNKNKPETFPGFYILATKNDDHRYIILATARIDNNLIGTVVTKSAYNDLGEASEYWDARQFERLRGSFTITQD